MFKHSIIRIALIGELVVVALFYVFGSQGFFYIQKLRHGNGLLQEQVEAIRGEIDGLGVELRRWESDPFQMERYAREQLIMSHRGDEIFLTK